MANNQKPEAVKVEKKIRTYTLDYNIHLTDRGDYCLFMKCGCIGMSLMGSLEGHERFAKGILGEVKRVRKEEAKP